MKTIGLLMTAMEDDILERTIGLNAEWVDCFYALDGTGSARDTLTAHPKCWGYTTDAMLSEGYPDKPCDGYRQHLYEQAVKDHGYDNAFVLLHGDEVWLRDPAEMIHGGSQGVVFPMPFFVPRAEEGWDDSAHALDQLRWLIGPGWPEFRAFRGSETVWFNRGQHFNTRPHGLERIFHMAGNPHVVHYPYRSPAVQRARAAMHLKTGFDPDNYKHIVDGDNVFWTDTMIEERVGSRIASFCVEFSMAVPA